MHEAVTVGMVLWVLGGIAGFGVLIGLFVFFLSILADAFKH